MSGLKSKTFIIVVLPGLLLITWTFIRYLLTGEIATTSNSAINIGEKYDLIQMWQITRNFGYLAYLVYFLLASGKIFLARENKSLGKFIRVLLLTLGGAIFYTLSFFFAVFFYDIYSIFWTLINNPSVVYSQRWLPPFLLLTAVLLSLSYDSTFRLLGTLVWAVQDNGSYYWGVRKRACR